MMIIGRYRKLEWFDFLEVIEGELEKDPKQGVYLELADELLQRKLESLSEGAVFKLKAPAKKILEIFNAKSKDSPHFATEEEQAELKNVVEEILKK